MREITGPKIAGLSVNGFVHEVYDGETWHRIAVSYNRDMLQPLLFPEHSYAEYPRLYACLECSRVGPVHATGASVKSPSCPIQKVVLDILRDARDAFPESNTDVRTLIQQALRILRLPIDNGAPLSVMLPAISKADKAKAYVPSGPVELACIAIAKTALALVAKPHSNAAVITLETFLGQLSAPLGAIYSAQSPQGDFLWKN